MIQANSFSDTLVASFNNALGMVVSAVPRLLGFLIIVLIGWFVASLFARAVEALLRTIRFNDIAERTGLAEFITKMHVGTDASGIGAILVKWLTRIVVVLMAFDTLGLPAVSGVMQTFLLWIPNLVVAIVIIIIGGISARALGRVVRGAAAEAGFTNPDSVSSVARTAVWTFVILAAITQVGVAATLINTIVTGVVAALALASGLAFGLGGRDLAARTLEKWHAQLKHQVAPAAPTAPPKP